MKNLNELKGILNEIEVLDKSSSIELVIVENLNELINKYTKEKEKKEESLQFHFWDDEVFILSDEKIKLIEIINDLEKFRSLLYEFLEINKMEKNKEI